MASSENNPYQKTSGWSWFEGISNKLNEKTTGLSQKLDSLLGDSDLSLEKLQTKLESTVDEVVEFFDADIQEINKKNKAKESSKDLETETPLERKRGKGKAAAEEPAIDIETFAAESSESEDEGEDELAGAPVFAVVLGISQDGGVPQAGCYKDCCRTLRRKKFHASSLALVEQFTKRRWLIDCTLDFPEQLRKLDSFTEKKPEGEAEYSLTPAAKGPNISGIFLTHAHVGHYAGLLHLGKEVMNTREVRVYCMPQMLEFLTANAPWEQLVRNRNIVLECLEDEVPIQLSDRLFLTPFLVPHRGEYTETVGFKIRGPSGYAALWLPDIDSWTKFEGKLESMLKEVQIAFVDGTFYSFNELDGVRDITQVPHPPVVDTMALLAHLPESERSKVHFIHLNHTNPLLRPDSKERDDLTSRGFDVAAELMRFPL